MKESTMRIGSYALPALLLALAACGSSDTSSDPGFSINGKNCLKRQNVTLEEQNGATLPDKTIALTFDDGPSEVSAELSRYLKKEGVPAAFFINGANVGGAEEALDQEVADGHLLANHTHTHAALPELDAKDVLSEVELTDKVLAGRVPAAKLYFRPPFGAWSQNVMQVISTSAMQKYIGPVFWDIGDTVTANTGADWDCWEDNGNGVQSPRECGDLYLKEILAKKKGIVLMHDGPPGAGREKTVAMVKYLVPLLKAEGYKFTRLDDVPLTPLGGAGPANGGGTGATSGGTTAAPGVDPCK